jgi:hypothetical protein
MHLFSKNYKKFLE